ncbi:hypothetical protein QYQ99_25555 [Comamonas testosteroni]|uniref:hypothetical protein n=1 Tax=Comamonas testosteroni TaxID=285 RepID=UPI00265F8CEA|nr:hypothetical protein [Comamonas testosteroni]WKL15655.1 hypothetical protein QYQ99_25555 [Comamonas testosteroni]
MNTMPPVYLEAGVRNVLPFCEDRRRVGLGFDIPGQETVRVALTLESARVLMTSLEEYIKEAERPKPRECAVWELMGCSQPPQEKI